MEEVNDTMRHLWNKTYQGTGMPSSSRYGCSLKRSFLQTLTEFGFAMIVRVAHQSAHIITESVVFSLPSVPKLIDYRS